MCQRLSRETLDVNVALTLTLSFRPTESSILPSTNQQSLINAEKYFLPFELACASNHPRMVDTSLDCLQVTLVTLDRQPRIDFPHR